MIRFNFGLGPCIFTDPSKTGYGLVISEDWQAGWFEQCVLVGDHDMFPYSVKEVKCGPGGSY